MEKGSLAYLVMKCGVLLEHVNSQTAQLHNCTVVEFFDRSNGKGFVGISCFELWDFA